MDIKKYISIMLVAACASASAGGLALADESDGVKIADAPAAAAVETAADGESATEEAAEESEPEESEPEEPESEESESEESESEESESEESVESTDTDEPAETEETEAPAEADEPTETPAEAETPEETAEPTDAPLMTDVPAETAAPTDAPVPDEEKAYYVPVQMKNVNGSGKDSMGNPALVGDAYVLEKDGASEITITLQAVDVSSLHGHLLKLWSYETDIYGDMTEAEIIEYKQDAGLDGETPGEFPYKLRIKRSSQREDKIYIRISVDAMDGFDQDAILVLDYDNAVETDVIDEPDAEPTAAPVATDAPEATPTAVPEVSPTASTDVSPTPAATSSSDSKGGGGSSENEDTNNYLVDIAFWHEVSNQRSMGNSALENNPQALYKSNGVLQLATNPVEVSGYISAVTSILYDTTGKGDYESVSVNDTDTVKTGDEYDGTSHTVTYIALASFTLPDYIEKEGVEYINIKMRVPYTPMEESASLDDDGYMTARLRIDWSSKTVTTETALKADSSTGSGSASGLSGSSDDDTDATPGPSTSPKPGEVTDTKTGDTKSDEKTEVSIPYFADIQNHPLKGYIEKALQNGWFLGFGTDSFKPEYILTRAMAITVINRAEGGAVPQNPTYFSDIPYGAWCFNPAGWGVQNAIVKQYADGRFLPNNAVTREDVALMLYKLASSKAPTVAAADLSLFADGYEVSDDNRRAVGWCVAAGILSADESNKLLPKNKVTRADMAQMLVRYYASDKKWDL